ncbi:MAG: DNA-3-methyladenine glycosylase 2 family protein [Candidatus Saccharibacteria bacterium]|nr:DNA-3-methyladenine glycosylase 2 family protein [Candidatus Saccharibacteria bacterium]MCA9339904.1 DNA-3-methyladenine glycosylase 2 family protein [Candidatus Saccharibacteria bacterium]
MSKWEIELQQGTDWLSGHDVRLSELIARFSLPTFMPHKNYYRELVESIISQQLSVKAAATIFGRFVDHFGHFPSPDEIIQTKPEPLRACGLSFQKIRYIQDLAMHILDGTVKFDHLDSLSNDEIIAELTDVKGIGEWTVHMFLIFCMGRLDVLATDDLGVRTAIQRLYELSTLPNPDEMREIAEANHWHPYASLPCWYLWQPLNNAPKEQLL